MKKQLFLCPESFSVQLSNSTFEEWMVHKHRGQLYKLLLLIYMEVKVEYYVRK